MSVYLKYWRLSASSMLWATGMFSEREVDMKMNPLRPCSVCAAGNVLWR
jgi:hypothetical protein